MVPKGRDKAMKSLASLQGSAQELRRSAALWGMEHPEAFGGVGALCKELLDLVACLKDIRASLDRPQSSEPAEDVAGEPRLEALADMLDAFSKPLTTMHEYMEQQNSGENTAGHEITPDRLQKLCDSIGQIKTTLEVFTRSMTLAAEVDKMAASLPAASESTDPESSISGSMRKFLKSLFGSHTTAAATATPQVTLPTAQPPMITRKPVRSVTSTSRDIAVQTDLPVPGATTEPKQQETDFSLPRGTETMAAGAFFGAEIKVIKKGGRPQPETSQVQQPTNIVSSPVSATPVQQSALIKGASALAREDTETSAGKKTSPPAYAETATGTMVHPITGTVLPAYETIELPVAEKKGSYTVVRKATETEPVNVLPKASTTETHAKASRGVTETADTTSASASATQSSTIKEKPVPSSSTATTETTTTLSIEERAKKIGSPLQLLQELQRMWQMKDKDYLALASKTLIIHRWTNDQNLDIVGHEALAFEVAGNYQSALSCWQKYRKSAEFSYGKSHNKTLKAILHIGLANENLKQVFAAKSYYKQVQDQLSGFSKLGDMVSADVYYSAWWQMLNLEYSQTFLPPPSFDESLRNFINGIESRQTGLRSLDPEAFDAFFSAIRQLGQGALSRGPIDAKGLRLFEFALYGNIRPAVAAFLDRFPGIMWHAALTANPMASAALYGATSVLLLLLERGLNVDLRDKDGFTGLHNAVCEQKTAAVRLLSRNGANVNSVCDGGSTPLISAIRQNNAEMVKLLINLGANFKAPEGKSWSPLIVAVCDGLPNMVDLLLASGAPLEDPDVTKGQAIHAAAMEEKCTDEILLKLIRAGEKQGKKIIDSLMDCPADKSFHNSTPLQLAITCKRKSRIKLLLDCGANVNHRNAENGTAVYYAAQAYDHETLAELVKRGANINARIASGSTALSLFAMDNEKDAVVCLIQGGADINVADNNGVTPLGHAIRNQKLELVTYLLDCGADPNYPDGNGWTPLMVASTRKDMKIVQALLNHKANLDAQNKHGYTALQILIHKKMKEPFDMLMKAGASVLTHNIDYLTTLMSSLLMNDEETKYMFQSVSAALLTNKEREKVQEYLNLRHREIGYTALNYAAEAGNNPAIRLIVQHGNIDINVRETARGFTPLTHAADAGHVSTCELLISLGAKVFVHDLFSGGPLGRAIRKKHLNVVKLLIQADPNLIKSMNTAEGMSFLESDELDDKIEIMEFLLQSGADPNRLDPYGCTPLHWARINRRENHKKVIRLLQMFGGTDQGGSFDGMLKGFHFRLGLFEKNFQWNRNRTYFKTFLKWMDVACALVRIGYYDDAIVAAEQTLEFEFEENKDADGNIDPAAPRRRVLFEGKTNRSFSWICEVCDKLMGLDTAARFYMCKSCSDFTCCRTCYETNLPAWEERNNHEFLEVPRAQWYTLQEDVVDVDASGKTFTQETWLDRVREINGPPPGHMHM